jgi:hypothetical protein
LVVAEGGKGGGGGSEAGGGGDIMEAVGGKASRTVIRLGAGKRDPIPSVLQREGLVLLWAMLWQ